jgi:ankyrin repeat protein
MKNPSSLGPMFGATYRVIAALVVALLCATYVQLLTGVTGVADAAGSTPGVQDIKSWFGACESDDVPALENMLQTHPTLLNIKMEDSGYTCLMLSSLSGSPNAADFLLTKGANPKIEEKDGYTPMHGVGFQGRFNVLPVLLAHGLNPSDKHRDGYTPIHRAAWGTTERHTETVRALLEAGVSPFEVSKEGKTARQMSNNKATQKLLKKWEKKERAMRAEKAAAEPDL